jgi:hypothetical protein
MAVKIMQCGYMSGDTYAAAALLAVDTTARIILVKDTRATGQYADKSGLIQKIYGESGVMGRVHLLDITAGNLRVNDLWKLYKDAYTIRMPAPPRGTTNASKLYYDQIPVGWPRSITAVTGLLASRWEIDPDGTSTAIATAWKVGKLPTEQKFALYGYMGQKFQKNNFNIQANIVVLWSRQSGKRGGAHPELDSSYAGIRQLARALLSCGKPVTVLLAGDERNDKLNAFANLPGMDNVISVSDMWEDAVWKEHFGSAKFLAQFAFYKYLAEEYNVIHIGMRSGMLESMALLGMKTFYLEGAGSGSAPRMGGFSRAGITYSRIIIGSAPGITGRISEQRKLYTNEVLNERIDQRARVHWNRAGFWDVFGDSDASSWAAVSYAKADLLGQSLRDSSYHDMDQWSALQDDMARMRGFTSSDMTNIFDAVGPLLKDA